MPADPVDGHVIRQWAVWLEGDPIPAGFHVECSSEPDKAWIRCLKNDSHPCFNRHHRIAINTPPMCLACRHEFAATSASGCLSAKPDDPIGWCSGHGCYVDRCP